MLASDGELLNGVILLMFPLIHLHIMFKGSSALFGIFDPFLCSGTQMAVLKACVADESLVIGFCEHFSDFLVLFHPSPEPFLTFFFL